MLYFRIVLIIIGFCAFWDVTAQNFNPINIPIYKNGQLLPMSNAGGLRNPHFSNIDIDGDGVKDLLVFDRTGNQVLPFIKTGPVGSLDYTYVPELSHTFPKMRDWALLVDYNGDGIEDLFTAAESFPNCCIEVWKGERSPNGTLKYKKILFDYGPFRDLLQIKLSNGNFTNLYTSNIDIPAIVDVDDDGDIDIISFDPGGRTAIFNRNMAVELGLSKDSLIFERETTCWGNFVEGENDESITLSSNPNLCAENINNAPSTGLRHSGSTLLVFDSNGNGLPDLIIGDIGSSRVKRLINAGQSDKAHMVAVENDFPFSDTPINIRDFVATFYVDVDGDEIRDLIATTVSVGAGQNYDHIWLYRNEGTNNNPIFKLVTKNFLIDQMPYFYGYSHPTFADINQDGLMDIIVGTSGTNISDFERDNRLVFLRNIGTQDNPLYQIEDENYLDLAQNKNLQGRLAPHFADLDNDGDEDLILGDATGKLIYFENSAGPHNVFSFSIPPIYPFPSDDFTVLQNAKPFLFDVNGDKLLDIVVGKRNTQLHVLINQGTQEAPQFNSDPNQLPNIWNLGEFIPFNFRPMRNGAPHFIHSEGKILLIFGTEFNGILTYDTHTDLAHSTFSPILNTTESIIEDMSLVPALHDIDNDGYYEMAVGNARGGLSFFNTTFKIDTLSSSLINLENNISVYPNPSPGWLSISAQNQEINIELLDINGQFIRNLTASINDLSDIKTGMYLIKWTGNGEIYTKKLVIIK